MALRNIMNYKTDDILRKKARAVEKVDGRILTLLEDMASDEQREKGLDIADFLLMKDTQQMVLQKMIARNPSLQKLIDAFGLEIVEE